MARQRMLHRQIQEMVQQLKSWAGAISDYCVPPSLSFYADEPGAARTYRSKRRARKDIRPDEYLANNLAALTAVELYARGVALRADEIAAAARKRINELEAGQ